MRIAFVVERPTQFEAPFYRYAARDPRHELRVLFTAAHPEAPVFDPELGRTVSWGIDLLSGYPSAVAPASGRGRWLARQLRRGGCDLLIVNGYTRREYLLAALVARQAGIPTALRLDSALWRDGTGEGAAYAETVGTNVAGAGVTGAAVPEHAPPPSPPARALRRPRWRSRLLFSTVLPRLYDLFLGVGSLSLDHLAACGVAAERRGLFPYAVDVERFRAASRLTAEERAAARARLGLAPAERAVLAVAKLNAREGPWDLVRALPHLPAGVRLLLAGEGPARPELERLAAELGPGRTRLLGYVPYPELPALYAAADLFVHPAHEERWGVSVAEALACGLPVVASTRVGAGWDLVRAGANGWLYPAGDAAQLARRAAEALALDLRQVAAASSEALTRWDYAASWGHLLAAGERAARGAGS